MRIIPQARKWLFIIIPLAALLQAFLQYAWQYVLYSNFTFQGIPWPQVFFAAVNWLVIFSVWASMYLLYRYMEANRQTEITGLKLQALQNEIELSQLKSQLNPHFLFNSLNSIRALVHENPSTAREAVTRLSEMLRQTFLSGKKNTITLEEEMNLVKDYLALEKLRFEERLVNEFNIDTACLNAQVPPFLIQTLVENAIKHGISKLTHGGKISIDVRQRNTTMEIEIRNTGQLTQPTAGSTGIGWGNSHKRIELLYGKQASFTVRQENNEVICLFQIPFRKNAVS